MSTVVSDSIPRISGFIYGYSRTVTKERYINLSLLTAQLHKLGLISSV
jgi:hypothetical protein